MPDRDVKTLRDPIWYQYAKIIARRTLVPNAKQEHYGFVKQTLRNLQSGKNSGLTSMAYYTAASRAKGVIEKPYNHCWGRCRR